MKNSCYKLSLLLSALLLQAAIAATALADADDAVAWIKRMEEAVEYRNYSGTLVYMRSGKADTFRVYHRVEGRQVTERLLALDGDGAEIIRRPDELICIFPAQRTVMVGNRENAATARSPLQSRLPEYSAVLRQYYSVNVLREGRAVGRPVVVVGIDPLDDYRYGHRLWLDKVTAMPLKSQLLDSTSAMPIEEVFFTSIEMPELLNEDAVLPSLDTDSFTWIRQNEATAEHAPGMPALGWHSVDLPPGFALTTETLVSSSAEGVPRIHLVYSDGLASVSVFIDAGVAAAEQAEGLSMIGAANAYSVVRDGLMLTAMGAVPARTVERIAHSMRPGPAN